MKMCESHWGIPTQVHFGQGLIDNCHQYCSQNGIFRPLVVTDTGLKQHPMVAQLLEQLSLKGQPPTLMGDVLPNPTKSNISQGVNLFKQTKCDGIIAIGGGSALDAGKAIALMVNQTLEISHFVDEGTRWQDAQGLIYPVIAIPTTAGTGSEVGRCAVVVDESSKRKLILFHPDLLPKHVILDPQLTLTLPPQLTAYTGMDALSHNLEALCVDAFHPIADGIAKQGIALIAKYLKVAYQEPDNIQARGHMLVASTMGATAFQKGLGAMHAISHAIGGLYGGHHGMLNAILMPYVLAFNKPAIDHKCSELAHLLKLEKSTFDGFFGWVMNLREQLNVPHTLANLDFDYDVNRVIEHALVDPCAAGNPRPLGPNEIEHIFSCAIKGDFTTQKDVFDSKLKA